MFLSRFTLICIFSLSVASCLGGGGGGGGNGDDSGDGPTTPETTDITVRGKVIDGYISGATVFYDLDFDGNLDEAEPRSTTNGSGDFEVDVPEDIQDCIPYAPMVVDVPVGAIDADRGEVTEAYRMSLPPKMIELDLNEQVNITPLTSVLWGLVEVELFDEKPDIWLNCQQFIDNQNKILEVTTLLSGAIADVAQTYDLTADEVYDDFIAEQASETAQQAASLVPVLTQSLSETLALKSENPDAWYVKVLFIQGDQLDNDGAYPDAWYKKTTIFGSDITVVKTEKVSDDLLTVNRTILYGEVTQYQRDNAEINVSYEFESRGGDASNYSCDSKELYLFRDGSKIYEIVNLVSKTANSFADCDVDSFDDDATSRYIFVDETQFIFSSRPFDALNDWFDFVDNYQSLNHQDAKNYADTLVTP